MGGGHVTRPDFNLPEADPANPMTEFYLLLQRAIGRMGRFTLPGAYVRFTPPGLDEEPLYAENLQEYCRFSGHMQSGFREIFPAGQLLLLYDELLLAPNGVPTALLLTEDGSRRSVAVQLLPPFLCEEEAPPPLPSVTAALTLQLTTDDLCAADKSPSALGLSLTRRTEGKQWIHHPQIDRWLTTALAAAQREARRQKQENASQYPPFGSAWR